MKDVLETSSYVKNKTSAIWHLYSHLLIHEYEEASQTIQKVLLFTKNIPPQEQCERDGSGDDDLTRRRALLRDGPMARGLAKVNSRCAAAATQQALDALNAFE